MECRKHGAHFEKDKTAFEEAAPGEEDPEAARGTLIGPSGEGERENEKRGVNAERGSVGSVRSENMVEKA